MNRFKLERTIGAPLEKVWAAADFTKSAGPFPMEVAEKGDPALHGVGFVRVIINGKRKVYERLESVDPPRAYTYTLFKGAPLKNGYLGKVALSPQGTATQLVWTGTFAPKIPGSGWLIALMIKKTVSRIIDAIEAESLR